jgi:hypothetical protein
MARALWVPLAEEVLAGHVIARNGREMAAEARVIDSAAKMASAAAGAHANRLAATPTSSSSSGGSLQ